MKAAILEGPRSVRVEDVPDPRPSPGEVLVRLEGAGICGSELPVWQGRPWFDYPRPPGAPGHEGWGRIVALGDEVVHLQEGERVALVSQRAHAELDVAAADAVVPIPDEISGPFPGEALGCAWNVFERAEVHEGQFVAVVGSGFLGTVVVALCAAAGARVIAISRRPTSLAAALRMGARETVSLDHPDDAVKAIEDLTGGRLCERVVEAAGLQVTLDLAARLTRVKGRLVIAGYHQDGPRTVDMQLWNWRGLEVVNAHEREVHRYVHGIYSAAKAIAQGALDPTPLYTHIVPFTRIDEAFTSVENRPDGFMKAVWSREA